MSGTARNQRNTSQSLPGRTLHTDDFVVLGASSSKRRLMAGAPHRTVTAKEGAILTSLPLSEDDVQRMLEPERWLG